MPNTIKRGCRWVLTPNTIGQAGTYCDKPVKYHYVKDDDWNMVRDYDHFCPQHMTEFEHDDY
jgi:hypothetical protein